MKTKDTLYEVYQKGKLVFTGSINQCWTYVHKNQSMSVSYAERYGGWIIKRKTL